MGFVGFRWQRSMHGEDSSYLLQSREHVVSFRGKPFRLDRDMAGPMEDAFYNCWTMVKIDLYYAGALLNPYLLYDKRIGGRQW